MMIRPSCRFLSYAEAAAIADRAGDALGARLVVLDLSATEETTTAALARLIVLRQQLLRAGRDLRLVGLSGRAESLYEICRLSGLLPRSSSSAGSALCTSQEPAQRRKPMTSRPLGPTMKAGPWNE